MILMEKYGFFEFSLRVCSMELRSLVSSLEYLVSNRRQVVLVGIRLGSSTTFIRGGGVAGSYAEADATACTAVSCGWLEA